MGRHLARARGGGTAERGRRGGVFGLFRIFVRGAARGGGHDGPA